MQLDPPNSGAPPSVRGLTLQMLAWIATKPRTYSETLEAWRSTCPRLSIWEDALNAGLLEIGQGATTDDSPVTLTSKGRALLNATNPGRA